MKKKRKSKRASTLPRRSSGDAVHVQIVTKVEKGYKFTARQIDDAIRKKAELSTGEWRSGGMKAGPNPPGMKIEIIWWTNRMRSGKGSSRRYAQPEELGQDEAWGSLRRVITGGVMESRKKSRSHGGVQR